MKRKAKTYGGPGFDWKTQAETYGRALDDERFKLHQAERDRDHARQEALSFALALIDEIGVACRRTYPGEEVLARIGFVQQHADELLDAIAEERRKRREANEPKKR